MRPDFISKTSDFLVPSAVAPKNMIWPPESDDDWMTKPDGKVAVTDTGASDGTPAEVTAVGSFAGARIAL